jgi:cytochrome c oxidase assembly protein subunit 15
LRETLAIVHACLAQAFFALVASIALFTSPQWHAEGTVAPTEAGRRLWRLGLVTTGLIYAQIVMGALLRHTGQWLEAHVFLAVLVSLQVVLMVNCLRRQDRGSLPGGRSAVLLATLLGLQLALGVAAYVVKFTATASTSDVAVRVGVTTAHLAMGSLLLVTCLICTLRTARMRRMPGPTVAGELLTERVSS